MIKKLLYILFTVFSYINISVSKRYVSSSYIDRNNIYILQNYCVKNNNNINNNCYTISKIDLINENSVIQKEYNNLNKQLIKDNFSKINLNKLLSNIN